MDAQKLYDPVRTFRVPDQIQKHLDELKSKLGRKNYSQVIIFCIERTWQNEVGRKHRRKNKLKRKG